MEIDFRTATSADVVSLAPRLRQADHDEIMATVGAPPLLALPQTITNGIVVTVDGSPEVLFGVDPVRGFPEVGVIWLVSSSRIEEHKVKFLRTSKHLLDSIQKDYLMLTNFCDARNELHHKWLKWLGFVFIRRIEKYGAEDRPFYEFVRV